MASHIKAGLLLLLTSLSIPAADAATLTAVALNGDPIPGGNGKLFDFSGPVINEAGHVAFFAELSHTSGGGRDNAGLFRADGSALVEAARAGAAIPNVEGVFAGRYDFGNFLTINEAGQVAFSSRIYSSEAGRSDRAGIFRTDGTGPRRMVVDGDPISEGLGNLGKLESYLEAALNNSGQIAFSSDFNPPEGIESRGIFRSDGTNITLIAATDEAGQQANRYPYISSSFALNDLGEVAFVASVRSWDDYAVLRKTGNSSPVALAVQDQEIAGGKLQISGFGYLSMNNAGHVAFSGQIETAQFSFTEALFRADGTTLTVLAREGQDAPAGGGQIAQIDTFAISALNASGQVAFQASTTDPDDAMEPVTALFRTDGTTLVEIARHGELTPGGNGRFGFDEEDTSVVCMLNDAGQVVFNTRLIGTAGGYEDNEGIFFFDDGLGLLTVARKGEPFLGSTFVELEFWRTGLSAPVGFINSQGQVVFEFNLNDGRSGVAVWTPPESGGEPNVRIRIAYDATSASIITAWTSTVTGVTLESSTDMTDPTLWAPVTATPVLSGSEFQVTQPVATPERFFRLKVR